MSSTLQELAGKTCEPCKGGMAPLEGDALAALHSQLGNDWQLVRNHHLNKEYTFPDFKSALAFVNTLGDIAESANHHPDLTLGYGKVGVTVFSHKIDGLTDGDFVFAAKTEAAYQDAV